MPTLTPERLEELRQGRHLSRWSVARRTGIPRAQLRRYESGEAWAPAPASQRARAPVRRERPLSHGLERGGADGPRN